MSSAEMGAEVTIAEEETMRAGGSRTLKVFRPADSKAVTRLRGENGVFEQKRTCFGPASEPLSCSLL
jgi:hypothetical protein